MPATSSLRVPQPPHPVGSGCPETLRECPGVQDPMGALCKGPWGKPPQGTVGGALGTQRCQRTALSAALSGLSGGHGGAAPSPPASPGLRGRGWWPGHGSQLPTWLAGDPQTGACPRQLCCKEGLGPNPRVSCPPAPIAPPVAVSPQPSLPAVQGGGAAALAGCPPQGSPCESRGSRAFSHASESGTATAWKGPAARRA